MSLRKSNMKPTFYCDTATICLFCVSSAKKPSKNTLVSSITNAIEQRLLELKERLRRLEPLAERSREDFDVDPYLHDIVERNLEIAAQCCIDVCNRIVVVESAPRPADYYQAIRRMGELAVLPADLSSRLAPIADFRNILAHEYLDIDWDEVYNNLKI